MEHPAPALATLYIVLTKTAANRRGARYSLADDAVLKKLSKLHKVKTKHSCK